MTASHEVLEKAQRLIDENRVVPVQAYAVLVAGDSGTYRVVATEDDIECSCPAKSDCSHVLAAMAYWEQKRQEAEHG